MQASTNKNVRDDGRPFAATMSAPSANGSAKIVWEKRISRRNRAIDPLSDRLINNLQKAFTEGNKENEVFLDTDATAKLAIAAPFCLIRCGQNHSKNAVLENRLI